MVRKDKMKENFMKYSVGKPQTIGNGIWENHIHIYAFSIIKRKNNELSLRLTI